MFNFRLAKLVLKTNKRGTKQLFVSVSEVFENFVMIINLKNVL